MDRKTVESYKGVCAQIVAEKTRKISDTVSASSPEYPYGKHTLTITGTEDNPHSQKLHKLQRLKESIEEAVESIPDADGVTKAVISLHAINDMSWSEMAAKLGYSYTIEGVRKIYQRGMKKYF